MRKTYICLWLGILFLLFCSTAFAEVYPKGYDEAKALLTRLESGKGKAADWQRCADSFKNVYDKNPKWRQRVAALYRYGLALHGKAQRTGNKSDAAKAVSAYRQTVSQYPSSVLSDDALYMEARVHGEIMGDKKNALSCLDTLLKKYSKSDRRANAEAYRKQLGAAHKGKAKTEAKKPQKNTVRALKNAVSASMALQLGLSVHTVVLDAGHGGRDPGTSHNGVVEKEITFDVVKRVQAILEKRGFDIRLSRPKASFVSLKDRVKFSQKSQGDLFVSIHVNACDRPLMSGMETYILDVARDNMSGRLARKENANSGRLNDMDRILREILSFARTSESRNLAQRIQQNAVKSIKDKKFSIRNGGVKGAPFVVLVGTKMPSVLVELGYCTNKAEAARLKSSEYRQAMAQGIADGISSYAKAIE